MIAEIKNENIESINNLMFSKNIRIVRVDEVKDLCQQKFAELIEFMIKILDSHQVGVPVGVLLEVGLMESDKIKGVAIKSDEYNVIAISAFAEDILVREYSELISIPQFGGIIGLSGVSDQVEIEQMAKLMARIGIIFLVLHEYAHLLHGHLSVLSDGSASVCYVDDGGEGEVDQMDRSLTSRTLEMDADSFASSQAFARAKELLSVSSVDAIWRLYNSSDKIIQVNTLTVYLMFRIMDFAGSGSGKFKTHPSPFPRSMMANMTLCEFIRRPHIDDVKREYTDFASEFIFKFLEAEISIGRSQKSDRFIKGFVDHHKGGEFSALLNEYARIYSKLDENKLGEQVILAKPQKISTLEKS